VTAPFPLQLGSGLGQVSRQLKAELKEALTNGNNQ
jgi:hypothetical protein